MKSLFNILVAGLTACIVLIIVLIVIAGSALAQQSSVQYKQVSNTTDYAQSQIIYTHNDSIPLVKSTDFITPVYTNTYSITEITLDDYMQRSNDSNYFSNNGKFYYRTIRQNNLATK